jgi:hypothetical protein
MLTIVNDGPEIKETNYFDSEWAKRGALFLSWNDSAARLLVPDAQLDVIQPEIQGAEHIILSRGPLESSGAEALELLWEDNTQHPFVIHISTEQCDRLIAESHQGSGFVVSVWARDGKIQELPGRHRIVESLPCMKPWTDH